MGESGDKVGVQDLIAKAREQVAKPEVMPVQVVVSDQIVEIGFTKLLGADWVDLTARSKQREGVSLDTTLGYNVQAASQAYPNVTVDGETVTADEWEELFGLLDAPWRERIATALWGLNQYGPQTRLAELGKVSRAGSRKKRN